METSTSMKEEMVRNYITQIDFTRFNESDLTVSQIKNDLRGILKENPAVDIVYKGDVMITENDGQKSRKVVEAVQSIVVAFIDGEYNDGNGNLIPKVHKFEYMVG